jgi:hypothetical protein
MVESVEPIDDDELLFRRVPVSAGWHHPDQKPVLEPEAFRPNKNDSTGISLFREKYTTIEEAARGRPGRSYYVAVLRAGDLRASGMDVVPRPLEGSPGHVEIGNLTYENRKSRQAVEWRFLLAERLCLRVEGPFSTGS